MLLAHNTKAYTSPPEGIWLHPDCARSRLTKRCSAPSGRWCVRPWTLTWGLLRWHKSLHLHPPPLRRLEHTHTPMTDFSFYFFICHLQTNFFKSFEALTSLCIWWIIKCRGDQKLRASAPTLSQTMAQWMRRSSSCSGWSLWDLTKVSFPGGLKLFFEGLITTERESVL